VSGGIPRKKVTAVFADEGTFKTTVVAQMMDAFARDGHTVLNITLEDDASLVSHRYLARLTGVPYGKIHGGTVSAAELLAVTSSTLAEYAKRVFIVDDLEPSWDRVLKAVACFEHLDAVIIDYIQMFGRDPSKLDEVVFGAQRLAKERNIAIILVSQRTKPIKDDSDPRPKTHDMFGSSAMRMGVKLAVGLFRPWQYCRVPSSTAKNNPYAVYAKFLSANPTHSEVYPNVLEVHVTKNILGPSGALWVRVVPETGVITTFDDMRAYV
jgi:KaiC/GvpD/RAD55 family RecA-like ATPase